MSEKFSESVAAHKLEFSFMANASKVMKWIGSVCVSIDELVTVFLLGADDSSADLLIVRIFLFFNGTAEEVLSLTVWDGASSEISEG